MMELPVRARYGAKDNRHDLLEWTGGAVLPPSVLADLTDMPGRHPAPGDCWWPAVGCGPVGDWWALWWTVPDENARRAGMVRSEVALWPSETIGKLDDLRPVMVKLGGVDAIPAAPVETLQAVVEALVRAEKYPPVLPDLSAWPGILADVWRRLWPEARQNFAARVAFSPPQGGESVAPPWLYAVPSRRKSEWVAHSVIAPAPLQPIGRAAQWLVGGDDPSMEAMLAICQTRPQRLTQLKSIAWAADCLDTLRQSPNSQHALDFLRILLVLAPDADIAIDLKTEALRVLEQGFPNVPAGFILSLRNLKPTALPAERCPDDMLGAWVSLQTSELSLSEASQLLRGIANAETWWSQAVSQALKKRLAMPDSRWAKAVLNWLGLADCVGILDDLLVTDSAVESRLFEATNQIEIAKEYLPSIREQTIRRGWSQLHAWVVMQILAPREALQAQLRFSDSPLTGLAFLVQQLPGVAVVEEAIASHSGDIIRLLAQRTVREPELLRNLDASKPAWLTLWAAHIRADGVHWPNGTNRETLGIGVLDAVLSGHTPAGLIAALAKDLAAITLHYPRREELWRKLSTSDCNILLSCVANLFIQQFNNLSYSAVEPERQLAEAVVNQLRKHPPSARLLAEIAGWNVPLTEREVIAWLDKPKRAEWTPTIAAAFGRAVYARRWKDVAEEVSWRFRRRSVSEFKPALEACYNLFGWLDQALLSLKGVGSSGLPDEDALVRYVAELGAEIAPDSLDNIWERAGGKRKQLKENSTPASRWHDAAKKADQGALKSDKNGLLALVKELQQERPGNDKLQELAQLCEGKNRNKTGA